MVNKSSDYQYITNSVQAETLALVPQGTERILDIGGGTGDYVAAAKSVSTAGFGAVVDISPEAVAARRAEVDVSEVCDIERPGELERFIETHGPFDLILCCDVLEHLVDPWRVVARLHAVMPEGGYILASIPNVQNYRVAIRALTGTWGYRDSGLFDRTHLRYFSRRSAIAMMGGTGLSVAQTGCTYGPAARDRLAGRLSLGVLNPWVSMQNLVLVQKRQDIVRDPGAFGEAIEQS